MHVISLIALMRSGKFLREFLITSLTKMWLLYLGAGISRDIPCQRQGKPVKSINMTRIRIPCSFGDKIMVHQYLSPKDRIVLEPDLILFVTGTKSKTVVISVIYFKTHENTYKCIMSDFVNLQTIPFVCKQKQYCITY